MADAAPARLFGALSDPKLLDAWWTLRSSGQPKLGETYELFFGGPRHPFCWAMYLRLMKRHLETGEQVPYAIRLDV